MIGTPGEDVSRTRQGQVLDTSDRRESSTSPHRTPDPTTQTQQSAVAFSAQLDDYKVDPESQHFEDGIPILCIMARTQGMRSTTQSDRPRKFACLESLLALSRIRLHETEKQAPWTQEVLNLSLANMFLVIFCRILKNT